MNGQITTHEVDQHPRRRTQKDTQSKMLSRAQPAEAGVRATILLPPKPKDFDFAEGADGSPNKTNDRQSLSVRIVKGRDYDGIHSSNFDPLTFVLD